MLVGAGDGARLAAGAAVGGAAVGAVASGGAHAIIATNKLASAQVIHLGGAPDG